MVNIDNIIKYVSNRVSGAFNKTTDAPAYLSREELIASAKREYEELRRNVEARNALNDPLYVILSVNSIRHSLDSAEADHSALDPVGKCSHEQLYNYLEGLLESAAHRQAVARKQCLQAAQGWFNEIFGAHINDPENAHRVRYMRCWLTRANAGLSDLDLTKAASGEYSLLEVEALLNWMMTLEDRSPLSAANVKETAWKPGYVGLNPETGLPVYPDETLAPIL